MTASHIIGSIDMLASIQLDRQTDMATTATLAVHAHQGLITVMEKMYFHVFSQALHKRRQEGCTSLPPHFLSNPPGNMPLLLLCI